MSPLAEERKYTFGVVKAKAKTKGQSEQISRPPETPRFVRPQTVSHAAARVGTLGT